MASILQRAAAAAIAFAMVSLSAGSAIAVAPADHSDLVDAWVAALETRDAATVKAMPWGPSVAVDERDDVARAVLDALAARDPAAAAALQDDDAVELLSGLMFDRDALFARVQAEAAASLQSSLPPAQASGAAELLPSEPGLVEGIEDDVRRSAQVPEPIASIVAALNDDAERILDTPTPPMPSPVAAIAAAVEPDIAFQVCWISAAGPGCDEIVPLAPIPLDVTGDGAFDVLATLSIFDVPSAALALGDAPTLAPQLSFRVERLPSLDVLPLEAAILGVFVLADETLIAGFDAFSADVPEDARQAPASLTIVASALGPADNVEASVVFEAQGAGEALRALAGTSTTTPWDPERLLLLDTSPVPGTLSLATRAWTESDASHFEAKVELDRVTDLTATLRERPSADETVIARLVAEGVGPALALAVERGPEGDEWDWETVTPIGTLAYEMETTLLSDGALASWTRESFVLEGVPARISVDLPGHGAVELEADQVLGAARVTRHTFNAAEARETYDEVSVTDVPLLVSFSALDTAGRFEASGDLGSVTFQSASVRAAAPGPVAALLFDLDGVGSSNFVGLRGDSALEGRSIALRMIDLPEQISFTLAEVSRGVDLDLQMSKGLGEVNGILDVDGRRGILHLSNVPRDIHLAAAFEAATVAFGYDASSGIQELSVLYTDLALAPTPDTTLAYAQFLQLPRSVAFSLTRAGDAPRLEYTAATSTTDVRAFVDERLFPGDLRARVVLAIDDLGARTVLERVGEVLRLTSTPSTKSILIDGYVRNPFREFLSEHIGDDCCFDSFGYDIWYGYDIAATVTVERLQILLADVSSLDLSLHLPDASVTGIFADFLVQWETIDLTGRSSAWLRADLTVFWIDINVWDWSWSSASQFDLDVLVTRYVDQWASLASVSISPCSLSLDTHPRAAETRLNGFRFGATAGGRHWIVLNPLDARGQPMVPPWLVTGYMAWQHGGWRVAWDC